MNSFYTTSQACSCEDDGCHANTLCNWSGNMDDVTATPIYVQSVYDAVRFHLQGMKTIPNLKFTPAIPCGCTITRIIDIRCKKIFNPAQVTDPENLTLDMETCISGACFLNDCNGVVETIGPDGIPSEKIIFADTCESESSGSGTPIFGTQNVKIWGNIMVYLDIAVCDSCGRESFMTLCSEISIAKPSCPLVLTNFFELCMPGNSNSAFMPRLTELSNAGFNCRLATNSTSRDLCVSANGEISANLIVTICVTCEKKITVPVQLCVLSTGFTDVPLQENNAGMMNCPGLFPDRTDRNSNANFAQCASNPYAENAGRDSRNSCIVDDCSCGCGDFSQNPCK